MKLETFFDNFEMLAEAPNGVQKLRELILQLAVRGKLVAQDEKDEPALMLLEKITSEKEQHSKEGGIKKQKKLPEISEPEILFDLPVGWVWCRLNDFGIIFNGNSLNSHEKNIYSKVKEGLPYIATKDVGYGSLDVKYDNGLIIPFLEPTFKIAHANSILICSEGGSAGRKIGLINRDVCFGNKLFAIETFDGILPKYVFYLYQSRFFKSLFNEKMKGIIGGISLFNFLSLVVPLPPLNEQHRIVAIVDKLMSLCDELEARQQEKSKSRVNLNYASLNKFFSTNESDEFSEHWQLIYNNFDLLYDIPETVYQLRQFILQLAFKGKLVPQNPNDEPGIELLKQIRTEKKNLIAERKIKKEWHLPPFQPKEIPYELPKGWEWARILDAVERVTVGYVGPMTKEYIDDGIPFLRCQNVRENHFNPSGLQFISRDFHKRIAKSTLQPKDVVVVRSGNVGTSCVIPEILREANCSDLVIIKRPMALISSYLSYYMNSLAKQRIEAGKVGIALSHFNTKSVAALLVPIPPLAEQARIVARVDQLMSLCDELEAGLMRSQADSEKLMEAVVSRVVAAPD